MRRLLALVAALGLTACAGGTPNLRPLPAYGTGNGNLTGGVHMSGLLPNPQFGASLGLQLAPVDVLWFDGGVYGQYAVNNVALVGGDLGARLVLRTPVLDLGLVARGTAAGTFNNGVADYEVDGGLGLYTGFQLGPLGVALQPTVGAGRVGFTPATGGPAAGSLAFVGRLPVAASIHLGWLRLTAEVGLTARASFDITETLISPHAAVGLGFTWGKPEEKKPAVRSSGTP